MAAGKGGDCYLGLLYTLEDVAVYGYITPLKVKIVLALALTDSVVKDMDILTVRTTSHSSKLMNIGLFYSQIFKAMHTAYYNAMSNPFLRLENSIVVSEDISPYPLLGSSKWKLFRRRVDEIARIVANYPNIL